MEGRPFAIVGVNSDTDLNELKLKLREHQVTWRSFQDKRTEPTSISKQWMIRGWPTLILIDDQGTIQKRWVGAPPNDQLDGEVEKWIKVAEQRKLLQK
jgi:hypothetical protein